MQASDAIRFLFGAGVTYAIVAACGGGSGLPGHDAGVGKEAAVDALTDPVSKAHASDDTSGSRLRIQKTNGADGSSFVLGLFDSMLSVPCVFGLAGDGKTRCLPIGGNATASYTSDLYADAACTKPAAIAPSTFRASCGLPKYAASPSYGIACSTELGYEIRTVALWSGGSVYQKSGASCSAAAGLSPNGFFVLGSVVSPSTFVEGTVATD